MVEVVLNRRLQFEYFLVRFIEQVYHNSIKSVWSVAKCTIVHFNVIFLVE
jgi:hypothetical protein